MAPHPPTSPWSHRLALLPSGVVQIGCTSGGSYKRLVFVVTTTGATAGAPTASVSEENDRGG
jgi:hypothetical protein